MTDWLDSEEFNAIAYRYRTTNACRPAEVAHAFKALQDAIRDYVSQQAGEAEEYAYDRGFYQGRDEG